MNIINSKILQGDDYDHANPDIMDGVGHTLLKDSMAYINEILESSLKKAHPDLKYHGIRRLTANETFNASYRNRNIAYNMDISEYTTYMCEIHLTLKDVKIPNRYIWLLYSRKGGFVHLAGNKYSLVPIVSDKVISVDKNKIFMRLMIDKLSIESEEMNIRINGKVRPVLILHKVILIVKKRKLINKIGNIPIPSMLYSLMEYGYKETVKRICGEYIHIDITDGDIIQSKKQIVYQNVETPFKRYKYKDRWYYRDIKMVANVRRRTPTVDIVVSTMLYLFNMFTIKDNITRTPLLLVDELLYSIEKGDLDNEKMIYKKMFSFLVFKDNYNLDRNISEVNDHLNIIDGYIDSVVIKILNTSGVKVNNIYDLYEYVLINFIDLTSNSISYNKDIRNGYLDILYYIYYNNIVGINTAVRNINNFDSRKRTLTIKDVESTFNKHMRARAINNLHKSTPIALKSVDYTGDNRYVKITKDLAFQGQGNGVSRSNKPFIRPLQSIVGVDVFTGDIYSLQKKCPSSRTNFNMFTELDLSSNKFILSDRDTLGAEKLQRLLDGR